jgi:hypothetical protein
VASVSGSTLTLATPNGMVTVTASATTEVTVTRTIPLSSLKVGQTIRAVGTTAADGTVHATRIMVGQFAFRGPRGGSGAGGARITTP